uniref:Phosphoinositide-3-kinase n=1 Tax=Podoviridae sp. ctFkM10 TaxID=2826548 RepID=A0A8S5NDC2_9CAUD|nr:MAG TPA: phosphoinositide-3-kinase [Podoviridae sp. ctFkM10]
MKTTNYVVTVHWVAGKRSYLTTSFEEAIEVASSFKKMFPELRITLKRERREFEYWLNIILESAQQAT